MIKEIITILIFLRQELLNAKTVINMTVVYKDKKKFLKWLSDNIYQLDKFTKISPVPTTNDGIAQLVIEIGTQDCNLTIELDKDRVGLIDVALHCLSIAQSMSDEPIKVNGKAH